MTRKLHAMLVTIADESMTLDRYAARAQAFASSESSPPSECDMVEAWCAVSRKRNGLQRMPAGARRRISEALRAAAGVIVIKHEKLWDSLIHNVNTNNEEN